MNITHIISKEIFAKIGTRKYVYNSIVLSAIESIFSIQAQYDAVVKPLVIRFAKQKAKMKNIYDDEYTPSEFLREFEKRVFDDSAIQEVFGNLQLTSAKSGIRKGEAVKQAICMLDNYGVQNRQNLLTSPKIAEVEKAWREIKGQASGITWRYFLMLCGNDTYFKDDTWMYRFFISELGYKNIRQNNDYDKLKAAFDFEYEKVKIVYPNITKSRLDYIIWENMARKN